MISRNTIHFWHYCHHCGVMPISGKRYDCQTCPTGPDVTLCEPCYAQYHLGKVTHPPVNSYPCGEHVFVPFDGTQGDRFYTWLDVQSPQRPAPRHEKGIVVRPEFCFGLHSAFGGYGFIVITNMGRLLLTALHVMDEVIKKNDIDASIHNGDYSGMELPSVVTSVNLYDVAEEKWMFHQLGRCTKMLCLPDARLGDQEPVSYRDISAFLLDEKVRIKGASLARSCPEVGDAVWLATRVNHANDMRKAVVVEKNEESFVFRYDSNDELPRYCSGAPLLNEEGEVVAINVGAALFAGHRFGHGNHVDNVRKHLESSGSKASVSYG